METIKSYDLRLETEHFLSDYAAFRDATSDTFTYNEEDYTAVYLGEDDYAYINISSGSDKLSLIVNLQYYYVYGFVIDGNYFAYTGDAYDSLKALFTIPKENIIPYGDAYYQIGSYDQIDSVCQELVSLEALQTSIARVADLSIKWTDKNEDLLRMFWCLVEGVRFDGISTIVNDLLEGKTYNVTFAYFYFMAERWAELSIGTAYRGKHDSSIAVYELHKLDS